LQRKKNGLILKKKECYLRRNLEPFFFVCLIVIVVIMQKTRMDDRVSKFAATNCSGLLTYL